MAESPEKRARRMAERDARRAAQREAALQPMQPLQPVVAIDEPKSKNWVTVLISAGGFAAWLALASWSYTAATVDDMIGAGILLTLAFLVAVAALMASERYGGFANRRRLALNLCFAAVMATISGLLFWWEYAHRPIPGLTDQPTNDETNRLVSGAQFQKIREIEEFFGAKDENGLRIAFDLQNMLFQNINTQQARIFFRRTGREGQFNYFNFTAGGQLIVWIKDKTDLPTGGRLIVSGMALGPSGPNPHEGPRDVRYLVETPNYYSATSKLTEFENSVLPETIKKALSDFHADINNNNDMMLKLFDEYLHQDERYFTDHYTAGSPFNNAINNEFVGRMSHLKPGADRVLAAIAAVWRIKK